MTEQSPALQGRLHWPLDHPVFRDPAFANQMAVTPSLGPDGTSVDGLMLTFGIASSPMLIGTPEEQAEQAKALAALTGGDLVVDIEPTARVIVTVALARRIHEVLGGALDHINRTGGGST